MKSKNLKELILRIKQLCTLLENQRSVADVFTDNMARVLPDQGGFRFDYYVDDHGEEHVHVEWLEKAVEAKLNLTDGFPLEVKNDKFPDRKVTEARKILQHDRNRKILNKNIMKERKKFLAGNPHLMYDDVIGKMVLKQEK